MKKLLILSAFIISLHSYGQISKATLTAGGLTCSMCSKAVYKALLKVNFIQEVTANIQQSDYNIVFKKDAPVNLDAIKNAVEQAGFSVAQLKITVNFNNAAVGNDTMLKVDGENLHFLNVASQNITGEKELTLVDEHFTAGKEHKKYAQYTTMKCFVTGVTAPCCSKVTGTVGERMYHVTI